mgnify:CR=1 FL=1
MLSRLTMQHFFKRLSTTSWASIVLSFSALVILFHVLVPRWVSLAVGESGSVIEELLISGAWVLLLSCSLYALYKLRVQQVKLWRQNQLIATHTSLKESKSAPKQHIGETADFEETYQQLKRMMEELNYELSQLPLDKVEELHAAGFADLLVWLENLSIPSRKHISKP